MPIVPTDAELIRAAIESRLIDLHTSMPAVVVVYNPLLQTVDVQPVIKRALESQSGEIVHETLPIIHNVPMQWPGGGGYAMQFPILPGEHVWLIFSEAATAQWRSTGQLSEPVDLRRHDLSYACAIPCRGTDLEIRQPLTPPTEARMDCPFPFVFADGVAEQILAMNVAKAPPLMTYVGALLTAVQAAAAAANLIAGANVTGTQLGTILGGVATALGTAGTALSAAIPAAKLKAH